MVDSVDMTHDFHVKNAFNFRTALTTCSQNGRSSKPVLYRSSKLDDISIHEVSALKNNGIKAVIDFRSKGEAATSYCNAYLDSNYVPVRVNIPYKTGYQPFEAVKTAPMLSVENSTETYQKSETEPVCFHFGLEVYSNDYAKALFMRAPWYVKIYALIWLLIGLPVRKGVLYLLVCMIKGFINAEGLGRQYIDLVEYGRYTICAVFKLLADPKNVPAVLCCTHGKDRTGVVVAILQTFMGKSREFIVESYTKSEVLIAPVVDEIYVQLHAKYGTARHMLDAKPEDIEMLLDYIQEQYGSVEKYLLSIGLEWEELESVKRNLSGQDWELEENGFESES